ncbi:hypothetical protein, partial [Marinobacter sp. MBR-99]|uniref:hypothetical protein n=1 Tax=Marinobacter sp. MBR-99 TaxID=3156461 RepID=UPI003395672E
VLLAFLAHDSPPCGDDESELRHLSKIWGPLQAPRSKRPVSEAALKGAYPANAFRKGGITPIVSD